ncbi:MAG: XRE family transcriptional regulator [Brevundimonas sp.]|uniref:helix-turn-helix domain-containing protein n=1 Tax=Brevundimonas sp. TaxID=1871086 RepID=UPI0024886606|nr:XRE family transcriptional regulator [Brevundimonas sp.]MDI1328342.1 XRE family transcriptional regulator [Brevundimonas sp.]
MQSFQEKLVEAVKRKREAEGLSIRALSAAVGISFSSLARIERGEGQPDNNSKIRLLQWLGTDAEAAGLGFDNVAFVHFRAGKNIQSPTVQALLEAADCLRRSLGKVDDRTAHVAVEDSASESAPLSKDELEQIAYKFRADLGLAEAQPIDSLKIEVEGVEVVRAGQTNCLDQKTVDYLRERASGEWSAMSVPLDVEHERWAVLLNDGHTLERQRVTVLEEFWHILLGHKLTKIARIAEAFGRTYDKTEEHDAYYLASATLLPKAALIEAVGKNRSSEQIAGVYGTSSELVDYRVKRLGLWREHVGKRVSLSSD